MFQDDAEAFANLGAGLETGRGRRAKLADMFLEQLFADWRRHGAETIAQVRKEKPDQYLKLVAALLPRQTDAEPDPLDGLSDEQLAILVAAARDALGLPPQGTDSVHDGAGAQPAVRLPALSEATRIP